MGFWKNLFGGGGERLPKTPVADAASPGLKGAQAVESVMSIVHGPGDTLGFFERAYDRSSRTVELRYAFREDLPAWMTDVPIPLVPGKGIPATCYITLRAMKQLGVGRGEARAFVIRSVHEVDSVTHLDWLRTQHPNLALGELARQTHIFRYAETPIVQSGHRIVAVRVDETPAAPKPIGDLMTYYEQMATNPEAKRKEYDAVLQKYERSRTDIMLIGYDLQIEVEAWR